MSYEVTQGIRHHTEKSCNPTIACPFHAPSDHNMLDWPMWLRETGLIERTCPHGIGHPDPDSVSWLDHHFPSEVSGVHGCDGCCRDERPRLRFPSGPSIKFNPKEEA